MFIFILKYIYIYIYISMFEVLSFFVVVVVLTIINNTFAFRIAILQIHPSRNSLLRINI